MKQLAVGFAVFAVAVMAIVTYNAWPPKDVLALGNFVMLTLTLVVLVWYAYDTNSIARVTKERWMREGVLSLIYSMELIGKKGDAGRTLFRIHNPSTLVVRATVKCNFRIYGDPVKYAPAYDGEEVWLVFPQQVSQGWFEIQSLLQRKGKTVAAMIEESTPVNRENQLTMLLELEFRDELDSTRRLPSRRHYFDFGRWAWIPHITENSKIATKEQRADT
jgi:hypothetical protein